MIEKEIRFLDLSGIDKFNIDALPKFRSLEVLNLSNTNFQRMDILAMIDSLKIVNLDNMPLSDINPLKNKIRKGLILIGKEREIIGDYLNSQSTQYIRELENFSRNNEPMSERCRVAVCIPAFQEEKTIYRTLEAFLSQKDDSGMILDPSFFEVDIIVNRPENMPKDGTTEEIKRFIKNNKNRLQVIFIEKVFSKNEACVGHARKYINDLALLRSLKRRDSKNSLILIANDADILEVNNKYIINIIKEFDKNSFIPYVDAITGKIDFPTEAYIKAPMLLVSTRLMNFVDVVWRNKSDSPIHFRGAKLHGCNSAVRGSTYAIIGGYNPHLKVREDLEIGEKIIKLRGSEDTLKYSKTFSLITNPRRPLYELGKKGIASGQYDNFENDTEVREQRWEELVKRLYHDIDHIRIDDIEKEINSYFQRMYNTYYWGEFDEDKEVVEAKKK